MDLITNPTKTETPHSENESQPLPINSLTTTTTTVVKNHHHHHHPPAAVVVTYKECLKNHAASLGGHALDGCGEFMPYATATDPTSLKCAACGCHRNFHRHYHPSSAHFHHHHPLPVCHNSLSPPPLSTSHGLLHPLRITMPSKQPPVNDRRVEKYSSGRKRHRTKFSEEQKEKMLGLAEKIDWKMRRCDNETMVDDFCNESGICKSVVKVWMHNNKSTLGKNNTTSGSGSGSGRVNSDNNNNGSGAQFHISNNGSSSSS